MAEQLWTFTAYCNRCDRGFTADGPSILKAKANAMALLEAHVVKHDDYVPELHSEIDPE